MHPDSVLLPEIFHFRCQFAIMKRILLFVVQGLLFLPLHGDEGMWLPLLLKQLNEAQMQQMGMKISAEDIYQINRSSLKDAVLQFGRGCTGELISNKGLLITNHHCGYGQIQQHSSLENDYLKKGFWAKNQSEELPNPGLTVTFIIRMEDVSAQILPGLDTASSEKIRENMVSSRSLALVQKAIDGTHYEAMVRPMYQGNEYYLFVTETFRDVRLVGAPPASIGNYGMDTDNWTWPRHTGDFSLFRIYAGKDNKPADYSPDNVPFKPRRFFPVNLSGLQENDFTMVYGFPGRTNEYLSSYAVEQIVNQSNPLKVDLRSIRLSVMKPAMDADRETFIRYASKYSSVSNYHKKWSGETSGLIRADAVGQKQQKELEFNKRIASSPEWSRYSFLLPALKEQYLKLANIQPEADLMSEGMLSIEVFRLAGMLKDWSGISGKEKGSEGGLEKQEALKNQVKAFLKDYSVAIDLKTFQLLLKEYLNRSAWKALPEELSLLSAKTSQDSIDLQVARLFQASFLDDADSVIQLFERDDTILLSRLKTDPLMRVAEFYHLHAKNVVSPQLQQINTALFQLNRQYMKALRDVFPEKTFYPDANFTLRVAYGRAEGYSPANAGKYPWYTTAEGILEKYQSGNPDYELDSALAARIKARDFGRYADKEGKLRTCFIASNHTTGGNSGSPVLNGKGELVGVNFDRNWEGTMSDVFYDINQVRNIALDIRYALFIIDKVAGAGHLIKEMKIVR